MSAENPETERGELAIKRWPDALGEVQARIAGHFRPAEVKGRVRRYLLGLLSRVEPKNGWQMAQQVGEAGPHKGRSAS
ncbi:MAG: hypothetical protein CYG60_11760 [Actinobacteria bacterium]|nr:MAG: hypothetical protein CYG60_11760 [Actinomycetota bacterium]